MSGLVFLGGLYRAQFNPAVSSGGYLVPHSLFKNGNGYNVNFLNNGLTEKDLGRGNSKQIQGRAWEAHYFMKNHPTLRCIYLISIVIQKQHHTKLLEHYICIKCLHYILAVSKKLHLKEVIISMGLSGPNPWYNWFLKNRLFRVGLTYNI